MLTPDHDHTLSIARQAGPRLALFGPLGWNLFQGKPLALSLQGSYSSARKVLVSHDCLERL